ncbi:alkaline phosphatase family protein [Mucilaginibacter myungsuensis]|uniref:Alkaline phosphatase family protein n=1 Tax=Mucilaginibacter myungsuensis TaxID=649104 RepID=A0A929PZE5_9SPHI|nr:ectonucleotide pyrophosphatase/phosphodiesterase [Mucilaginibacter myungsuensis]MBE9664415.1 alkaline phosphatase family protein [Mucilaginibacter myungsuensis]MDN3597126.1 ectonucleotide pyrophosphatase/phosphodiesterase [Mucilaginibacter myungsuensis]
MTKLVTTIFFCLLTVFSYGQDTIQQINTTRINSKDQQKKPYVILISADGFRYDYAEMYKATHLLALAKQGVTAEALIPSYPSITFPNHYSIVTGMYPAHHGLVGNGFYDKKVGRSYYYKGPTTTEAVWYGGTPLWVLAEQQQMLTASFYWVASEAPIQGILPTYYYHYNEKMAIADRIQKIKNWLLLSDEKRPHLITVYFPEVDKTGHKQGPDAPETERSVRLIDSAVYEMTKAVKSTGLNVNFIFLSDHGMTNVSHNIAIELPAIDTAKFITAFENSIINIYAKSASKGDIGALYNALKQGAYNYKVFLRSAVPESLRYDTKNDRYGRVGDIVLMPDHPYVFLPKSKKVDPGAHGYDPDKVKDMHATFMAWGPNIKKGLTIPTFRNVNVYPIVTKILGLKQTAKIDGADEVAKKIVSPPAP